MKSLYTILLLAISNLFMTFAWYGHLQFRKISWLHGLGLVGVILVSWGLAFFEYVFQVPANRLGFQENGGPFSLFQLKVIQEVVSLTVFTLCAVYVFKTDKLGWNHLLGFGLLVAAVYVIFKKWQSKTPSVPLR
ncbi:DMT family protein [Hymenobacter elongatus]|uniref:DMT family protein n=1 Tax=Hymenobacter elongatus TaxID=877208 RepID=A0A4Z0PJ31_9BACT|nr:DMT family protein [Hymenobacter elongatus]TGE15253.1 hypothetical protein E5J99_12805 [Hymenobacter elongatus]